LIGEQTALKKIAGQPADNAGHFVSWLTELKGQEIGGVKYAGEYSIHLHTRAELTSITVFGAGNHDWVATYQRIPILCDRVLEERGGKRLLDRGVGDAGGPDFFRSFDEWQTKLWDTLVKVKNVP
jgi:cytochrome P450 / NADPH-cytochrome P450 reductase